MAPAVSSQARLTGNGSVRLLKINSRTGEVVAERSLETSVWSIGFAKIPVGLVPRDQVPVTLCKDGLQ